MSNANSDLVTNFLAVPQVLSSAQQVHGVKRVASGTIALAVADLGVSDTVMLAPIPSNATITSIKLFNDDLDSGSTNTADVGIYKQDLSVVDADAYASAITTLRSANTTGVEVAFEARDINKIGNKVWQDAGLSSDPALTYFVGVSFPAAGDTAGDLSFVIEYTVS
jgi:hypothetical protein